MWQFLTSGTTAPGHLATSILHAVLIDDDNPKAALQYFRDHPGGETDRLLEIAVAFDPSNPRLATDLRFEYATQRTLECSYHAAMDALRTAARKAAAHSESAYFGGEMRRFAALHSRRSTLQKLIKEAAAVLGLRDS